MDATEPTDDDAKAPDEHSEVPDEVSSGDIHPGPHAVVPTPAVPTPVVPAPVVPVCLIQVLTSNPVLPLISRSSSELPASCSTAASNLISDTPSAVNFVDKDGKILPTFPSIPGLVGNTVSSSLIGANDGGKVGPQALAYVDQNGRVLARVQYPLPIPDTSPVVRVVDSNGRITTNPVQSNTVVVDKNGRVISRDNSSPGKAEISEKNASSESDAGNFQKSPTAASVVQSGSAEKLKESTMPRNSLDNGNRSHSE